jgi:hypothetical protein
MLYLKAPLVLLVEEQRAGLAGGIDDLAMLVVRGAEPVANRLDAGAVDAPFAARLRESPSAMP